MVRDVVSFLDCFEGTEPMPTSFRECRDDEFMLLPVDMRDWLPEGHKAHSVRDLVREMDLSPFRRRHPGDFRHLFLEVEHLAREAGIMHLGTVAVDGTKVRANASRRKATGHGADADGGEAT